MAFPDTIFEKLKPYEGASLKGRHGDITLEEALKLASYHSVRRFNVSTESFGLVSIPGQTVVARLQRILDDAPDRIARIKENKGHDVEMMVGVYLAPPDHSTSWSLHVHGIRAVIPGTDNYYPVS